jgi:hypothetical protein
MELPKMQLQWQTKKQESESLFDSIFIKDDWRLPTIEELLRVKETGFKGIYFSSTKKNENIIYGVFFGKGKEKIELLKKDTHKSILCRDKG